jgi:hypothetical protein
MNPIGIALAFLVFWSLVAVGTFLLLAATGRLRRVGARRPMSGGAVHLTAADGVAISFHLLMGLFGVVMISAGLYASYVVILAR